MTTLQKTHRGQFRPPAPHIPRRAATRPSKGRDESPRKTYHPASVYLPVEPQPCGSPVNTHKPTEQKIQPRNGYDIAFSLGAPRVHAPALNIPQLGPRWVSAGMTLLLGFMLCTMWTASPFMVKGADVRGNQRLGAEEINSMLGMIGQPIFKAVPAQIETNLHTAFSDLASIKVSVRFPNRITVDVVERTPVLAWYQDGVVTWIDASGVAFTPRGEVPGWSRWQRTAPPPMSHWTRLLPLYEQKFITPKWSRL